MPPTSPAPQPTVVSARDQDQAAAFRAWVHQHGSKATREPQAMVAVLPELRARVDAGETPHASPELYRAGLDLVEAVMHHRLADHAQVEPCAERARAIFERVARETTNPALARELLCFAASCQIQVGNAHYGRSRYADALRAFAAARERLALLGERRLESVVTRNMGLCYEGSRLLHLAVECGLAAREIAQQIADEFELATHDNNLGGLYYELGENESARLCLERAQAFFARDGRGDYELQSILQLVRLHHRIGETDEALRWLDQAQRVSERIARRELESDRLKILATVLRSLGRPTEAVTCLRRAQALAEEVGDADRIADVCLEMASLAITEQRVADARAAAETARTASTAHGQDGRLLPDILGALADAARLAGDWPQAWSLERERNDALARAHQRAADARARALAVRHQLDLIREEAERRRLENLRLEEALARVAARLDASERAAAPHPETICAADLAPLGLRPRECEVLLWLVRGKSNEEIGLILGCSAETVKSHLKRIYAQLDVTNRTAATARALGGIVREPLEHARIRNGSAAR